MKMPQYLNDAVAATEAGMQREAAVHARLSEMARAASHATARIAELDGEIKTLTSKILGDDALAGVADYARVAVGMRAEMENQVAALNTERRELRDATERNQAGQEALAEVLATLQRDTGAAAAAFMKEYRRFEVSVWATLSEDLGSMTVLRFLEKWFAVAAALGFLALTDNLRALAIIGATKRTLADGLHHDPTADAPTDYKIAWRSNKSLVELHAALTSLAVFKMRVEGIAKANDDGRRRIAELQRLDGNRGVVGSAYQKKGFLVER
jgi:hypothetical protein